MSQPLPSIPTSPPTPRIRDGFPLPSHALFWRATYLRSSPWLTHIPFAFWLVEALQPNAVVQLGVGAGSSYFAFCQAVEKLSLPTQCLGTQDWEDGAVPAGLAEHNADHYQEFSRLASESPAKTARRFGGQVDLLHVDIVESGPIPDDFLDVWTPKLSSRAVLLLHGLAAPETAALLEKLSERHPMFVFDSGEGLAVIGMGEIIIPPLERLFALKPAEPEHGAIAEAFVRLGRGHDFECAARSCAKRVEALATARNEVEGLRENLMTHRSALAARSRQAAEAQAALLDLKDALLERDAQLESLTQQHEVERETLKATISTQAKALERRFVELATLTRMLESIPFMDSPGLQKQAGTKRTVPGMVPGTVSNPLAYARDLERRHAAILESATWRAMEPARRIRRWTKGRKPPPPFKPRLLGSESGSPPMDGKALLAYARGLEARHVAILNSTTWRAMEPVRRALRLLKGRKATPPFKPRMKHPAKP